TLHDAHVPQQVVDGPVGTRRHARIRLQRRGDGDEHRTLALAGVDVRVVIQPIHAGHTTTARASSGPLFRALFTSVLTGYASSNASSAGTSNSAVVSTSCSSGSSHRSHADSGRITGMRLWIGAMSSLAVVVTITHERSHPSSPPRSFSLSGRSSGTFQTSHSPANASGSPSLRWMK